MEKTAIDHQELSFLRFRDTAKTWTNASTDLTFLSKYVGAYVEILQDIEEYESLNESKFQFRTLFLQQSFFNDSMDVQMAPKNLGLSCLYYVLESTHNWSGKVDLESIVSSGKFKGYFQTQEHYERILWISETVGNCLESSSPYEFLSAILKPNCREATRMIIDLSLCTPSSCSLTAEEIFIGSCLTLSELKLNGKVSDWMVSNFHLAIAKACQLKEELVSTFQVEEAGDENEA